jgi:AcrR family transcriptional regulator
MLTDNYPFIKVRGDEERMSGVGSGAVQKRERSDAARSREKVMDAARRLFGERGVDTVSMHEIGREAGVGQGTLYRRFEHKGALCSALLGEKIEDFQEESRRRVGSRGAALGRLKWFLGRLAKFNEENGALLGAVRDTATLSMRGYVSWWPSCWTKRRKRGICVRTWTPNVSRILCSPRLI